MHFTITLVKRWQRMTRRDNNNNIHKTPFLISCRRGFFFFVLFCLVRRRWSIPEPVWSWVVLAKQLYIFTRRVWGMIGFETKNRTAKFAWPNSSYSLLQCRMPGFLATLRVPSADRLLNKYGWIFSFILLLANFNKNKMHDRSSSFCIVWLTILFS